MTVLKQSVIPWGTSNWPPDGPDHTPAPSGLELAPERLVQHGKKQWHWDAQLLNRYPLVKYSYGKSPF